MLFLGKIGPKEDGVIANDEVTNPEIPIACALNQAQFAERKRLVDGLAQEAIERRMLRNGVRLSFDANPGRMSDLANFVELERTCCPFLTFRIGVHPGTSVWIELTGPAAAQKIIRELIPDPLLSTESSENTVKAHALPHLGLSG
jgi:hypothetical protein